MNLGKLVETMRTMSMLKVEYFYRELNQLAEYDVNSFKRASNLLLLVDAVHEDHHWFALFFACMETLKSHHASPGLNYSRPCVITLVRKGRIDATLQMHGPFKNIEGYHF